MGVNLEEFFGEVRPPHWEELLRGQLAGMEVVLSSSYEPAPGVPWANALSYFMATIPLSPEADVSFTKSVAECAARQQEAVNNLREQVEAAVRQKRVVGHGGHTLYLLRGWGLKRTLLARGEGRLQVLFDSTYAVV